MTSTITTPAGGGFGARRTGREALAGFLSTASAETEIGRRVRGLLGELAEIEQDRELAGRYLEPGTWLRELAEEERDVWDHIVEALTAVSSANTKKEEQ
ncbi:hypothetical protein [Amycolatopsis dongchuanensis]|uniref:Uncharacterized protein n=1 Tax=Amycolatopsis dongchuanensis TaxID=1070866 RepID=A0ABP8VVY1_9PSEU